MNELIRVKFIENEDWDFRGADTNYLTHGLHPYPARMIPQIAARLLERYASPGDWVLDPFCGSGTVLVEARLHKINSIGIDVNPLACLLAEVKSTPINPEILKKEWKALKAKLSRDFELFRFGTLKVELPDFYGTNIDYWYKPVTMKELTIIRNHIEKIQDEKVRKFFEVPFSLTVRNVSGVKKGEYKLVRIPKEKWKKFLPNTLEEFTKNVMNALRRMEEFYQRCYNKQVVSRVFMADTRNMLSREFPEEANNLLLENPPKVIVTSPPYGDSRTTVAYGQFSRLSALWLSFEKNFRKDLIMSVDKLSLGGNPKNIYRLDLPTLHQTLLLIERNDGMRALDVAAFFSDLYKCLQKMYRVLADGGYCCIVIANRTVRRIQIPTHIIIAEMGVEIGFENDVVVIPRNIPTKRLPWENAPENIPGLKGKTMSRENIVIMRKVLN